jgi:hypothetical protein
MPSLLAIFPDIWTTEIVNFITPWNYSNFMSTCSFFNQMMKQGDCYKFSRLLATYSFNNLDQLPSTSFLYSDTAETLFIWFRDRSKVMEQHFPYIHKYRSILPFEKLAMQDERLCRGLMRYFFFKVSEFQKLSWFQSDSKNLMELYDRWIKVDEQWDRAIENLLINCRDYLYSACDNDINPYMPSYRRIIIPIERRTEELLMICFRNRIMTYEVHYPTTVYRSEFILKALKYNGSLIEHIPSHELTRNLIKTALRSNQYRCSVLPNWWCGDKTLVTIAFRKSPMIYRDTPWLDYEALNSVIDRNLFLVGLRLHPELIAICETKQRKYVVAAIRYTYEDLRYLRYKWLFKVYFRYNSVTSYDFGYSLSQMKRYGFPWEWL